MGGAPRPHPHGVLDRSVVPLNSTPASTAEPAPAGAGLAVPGRWGRAGVTLAVVLASTAYVWIRLSDAFYVHHDDLLQFSVSQEFGLSWNLLGLNVFGHFAPFNRLVHFLLVREAHLNLTAAALVVTGLIVVLLLTVLWLCAELRLPFWRRTFVILLTGFSVAVLDTAVWLDGAVHILAALAVTYLVVAAHLRGLNTGRPGWYLLSVLVFGLGFATQERPAFALPLIILIDWFLAGIGQPWRRRMALLWSARWPLAAMTVLGLVAAVLLRMFYAGAGDVTPTPAEVARVFAGATTEVLFPMLVGVVPTHLWSGPLQLAVAAVVLLAAVLAIRRNRGNAGPLAVILGTAVLYYGFLIFSPILTPATVEQNAVRLNNAVYLLVPTLVALAFLRMRPARSGAPAPGPGGPSWPRRYAPAAGLVLTAVVVAAVSGSFLERQWPLARQGHAYLAQVEAGKTLWSDPGVTLLPLRVPWVIADGWAEDYGRHAHFLKYYDAAWAPAPLGNRPVILDELGRVRDVVLREEAVAQLPFDGGAPGCVRSEGATNFVPFGLPGQQRGAPLFAKVDYRLTAAGDAPGVTTVVSAIDAVGTDVPSWQSFLPVGEHTVVLPLHPEAVTSFILGRLPEGATLCVTAASVVRPLYESGGVCQLVDEFGAPGDTSDCPGSRRSG